MKWIVAPTEEQKGKGELDFCWTHPGEILTLGGIKCSSGYPTDACGCCRAFSGLKTRKATTIGVIADIPISLEATAKREVVSFWQDTLEAKEMLALFESKIAELEPYSYLFGSFDLGTRVGVAFLPDSVSVFVAGSQVGVLVASHNRRHGV